VSASICVQDNNIVTSEHIIIPSSDAHDLPANHDEGRIFTTNNPKRTFLIV